MISIIVQIILAIFLFSISIIYCSNNNEGSEVLSNGAKTAWHYWKKINLSNIPLEIVVSISSKNATNCTEKSIDFGKEEQSIISSGSKNFTTDNSTLLTMTTEANKNLTKPDEKTGSEIFHQSHDQTNSNETSSTDEAYDWGEDDEHYSYDESPKNLAEME